MARGTAFTFGAENDEAEELEPFPIEVNGDEVPCVAEVDGLKILTFTAAMRDARVGSGERATAVLNFLRECIADWPQFEKVVAKHRVPIEGLVQIGIYLGDVYSDRPTQSAQSSSAGRTNDGPSSAGSSSSED